MSCDGECQRKRFWVCVEIICTVVLLVSLLAATLFIARNS